MTLSFSSRLAGLIAGAFLLRGADGLLSAFTQVTIAPTSFTEILPMIGGPLVGGVASVALGLAYMKEDRRRWHQVVSLILLAFSGCFAVFRIALPFVTEAPEVKGYISSMVVNGTKDLLVVAALAGCVLVLMRSKKEPNQSSEPTRI